MLDAFARSSPPRSSSASSPPRQPTRQRPLRCKRATRSAPLGRLPRPPHTARRDQGVGDEPAPGRRRLDPGRTGASSSQTIDEETDRLNALVGNLLDMSRLQPARSRSAPPPSGSKRSCPIALRSLGRGDADIASTSRRHSRACSPIPVYSSARSQTCSTTRSDSRRPDAPPRVTAGSVDGVVDVRIVDRGPGVPTDERERLFQPFQRLGDTSPRRASGSAWPSPRASSKRWAARSRSRTPPAAGSPSSSACEAAHMTRDPRRRRRAADPPRPRHEPQGARLRGRRRPHRRGGARRSQRASIPTSSSSTSASPASTGSR